MTARPSSQPRRNSRGLADPAVRAEKLSRVMQAPMADLNRLVATWRETRPGQIIPWFDPDDGGSAASVLVLMESPSPRTAADGETGFCSEDNTDATAAVFAELRARAGLARTAYVRWNVVPWPVYGADGHWSAPREADLIEAAPLLAELVSALPALRLVICAGAKSLSGYMRMATTSPSAPLLPVLGVPHPSQRNTRSRTEAILRIEAALSRAAELSRS